MTQHRAVTRRKFLRAAGKYTTGLAVLGSALPAAEMLPVAQSNSAAPTSGPVISRLARFVAEIRYDAIPSKALDTAKTAIMDCLGVAVAGGTEESARIAGRLAREDGGKETTTLFGQRFKLPTVQAALVNGIAAHAHDFDHSFVVGGQPTSSIIPATFTLGESIGASGRQVLEAYVAGFELVGAMMFALQNAGGTGWHANGTVGVFGASAACAKLLGLTPPQIETALAIAASMASGVTSNFGTMTKPWHVGQAARNGVLSARLAKAGFTANTQTLEARNGFFDCYYPTAKPELAPIEDLGKVYALEKYGVRFKPYPCGGLTHTSIYAAIRMRNENRITAQMVERVDVRVPTDTAAPLTFRVPAVGLEGKFSMPYLIARALIDGQVTLETFTDEAVRDKDVLQLLQRVEMSADPGLRSGSDGSRPATVTIRLKNGQTQTLHQDFPKGSPQVPMTSEELLSKFRACTRLAITTSASDRALEQIRALETLASTRPLVAQLRGTQ
ncbi:MAG TPA: MmgE/PrpD family protein [Terriglobia bacterium]|nr:MmgE/PrpD family protein [Terriglobia bacterium]